MHAKQSRSIYSKLEIRVSQNLAWRLSYDATYQFIACDQAVLLPASCASSKEKNVSSQVNKFTPNEKKQNKTKQVV